MSEQGVPEGREATGPVNDTRIKVGHLVAGLVFLGLAGSWALLASGVIGSVVVGWLLPAILVASGTIGLLAMLAGSLNAGRARSTPGEEAQDTSPEPAPSAIPEEEQ